MPERAPTTIVGEPMRRAAAMALVFAAAGCGDGKKRDRPAQPEREPAAKAPVAPTPQPSSERLRVAVGPCTHHTPVTSPETDALLTGITMVLRRETGAFSSCYQTALSAKPDLFGSLELQFTADPTQRPIGLAVTGFGEAALDRCIADRVAGLQLPTTRGMTLPVECRLVLGMAPTRLLADAGPKIEITADQLRLDGKALGKLGTPEARLMLGQGLLRRKADLPNNVLPIASIRAEDRVPVEQVLPAVAAGLNAGFKNLTFEVRRDGKWTYSYLPLLPTTLPPDAQPVPAPPAEPAIEVRSTRPRPVLAVRLLAGAMRVGNTEGKRWQVADAAGKRNFPLLADVLTGQRKSPVHLGRDDIELSAGPGITYRDLADTMNIISAQGFTDIRLVVESQQQQVDLSDRPSKK